MGTGFKVLVVLHVLCVIGGFGAVAYNGLYMSLAQQRPEGGTSAVLDVNRLVSGMAEILIYAALLFGIGAVGASHSDIKFSDAWVSAALGVYFALIGVMHGWIRPNQRRHLEVVRRLETPSPATATRQGDAILLKSLERKVGFGWAAFNILVIGAIYLMIFQPGG